jgi:hypothetical protein
MVEGVLFFAINTFISETFNTYFDTNTSNQHKTQGVMVIGTDYIGRCKSTYHTLTAHGIECNMQNKIKVGLR